jgi:adenosylcobyric acid synthase
VRWVTAPWHLDGAATVILPGSKHVASDLRWLRASGLDAAVVAAAGRPGVRVLGVCGGLQLLGRRLEDPFGVDGAGEGLGLLPLTTTFERDKLVRRRSLTLPSLGEPWAGLAGLAVDGYEIRQGRTTVDASGADALVVAEGNVAGWYLHGLFEDPAVLEALFGARPARTLDETFELLADVVEQHIDTGVLRSLAGLS